MMFVKVGRFAVPCRLRKPLIFLWMVTILLAILFLMIGIVGKIRDIIHNSIEVISKEINIRKSLAGKTLSPKILLNFPRLNVLYFLDK